jgi:FkbM family methyltransferase
MISDLVRFVWTHPLTRRSRARALTRVAAWQLRSRLEKEIIFHWIGGQRLLVRRGMTGATGNIYAGLHEFADMAFALHFLRAGDLFLDVGANVGSYTVLASGVKGARTIAFEPDPNTAGYFQRNVALNRLEGLVEVRQVALGASAGEANFTVGLDTVNRVVTAAAAATRIVRQSSLDDELGGSVPVLVKLDVEGYEEQVLAGAGRTLRNAGLKAIQCELVSAEINRTLADRGFQRMYYDPFQRLLSSTPVGVDASNALYVRDFSFVSERLTSAPALRVLGVSF